MSHPTSDDEDQRQDHDLVRWHFNRRLQEFEVRLSKMMEHDNNEEGRFTRAYLGLLPTPLVAMFQTVDWDNAGLPALWQDWLEGQLSKFPADRSANFALARCVAEGLVLRGTVGYEPGSGQKIVERLTEIVL